MVQPIFPWPGHKMSKKEMSQAEIHYRCGNLRDYLWWRFMPGITIEVPWPTGEIEVGPNSRNWAGVMHGSLRQLVESADPNDHYRPWLEYNVGRQRWDWDWRIGYIAADNLAGTVGVDTLLIKVRMGKSKWAVVASLMWM